MERHTMRKIREILRLKHESGLSDRAISESVRISKGSVSGYVRRAAKTGLTWEIAQTLDDQEIEQRLFTHVGKKEPRQRAPIDFGWVHRELKRSGVTQQLLWVEYRDSA